MRALGYFLLRLSCQRPLEILWIEVNGSFQAGAVRNKGSVNKSCGDSKYRIFMKQNYIFRTFFTAFSNLNKMELQIVIKRTRTSWTLDCQTGPNLLTSQILFHKKSYRRTFLEWLRWENQFLTAAVCLKAAKVLAKCQGIHLTWNCLLLRNTLYFQILFFVIHEVGFLFIKIFIKVKYP